MSVLTDFNLSSRPEEDVEEGIFLSSMWIDDNSIRLSLALRPVLSADENMEDDTFLSPAF